VNDTLTGLKASLAAAEAELDVMAEETRAAYREYRILDDRQSAKALEVRDLRRQIPEAAK